MRPRLVCFLVSPFVRNEKHMDLKYSKVIVLIPFPNKKRVKLRISTWLHGNKPPVNVIRNGSYWKVD